MESQICRNSSNPLSAAPLNFCKNGLKSGEEKQNIFTLESFFFRTILYNVVNVTHAVIGRYLRSIRVNK